MSFRNFFEKTYLIIIEEMYGKLTKTKTRENEKTNDFFLFERKHSQNFSDSMIINNQNSVPN